MTVQKFAAAADLQGLIAYLGIMATLSGVAWATCRDRQKEGQRKRALAATAAVAANPKSRPDEQRRAARSLLDVFDGPLRRSVITAPSTPEQLLLRAGLSVLSRAGMPRS
jgi:hypothetical protein